ncbi:MAG: WbqC family protein [Bacteroidales bacterium]|nr:WbqC family protein [Bacteroidales bacterium]
MYLSTAYFPPVSWFAAYVYAHEVVIEDAEHYLKQTYRNRCRIYSAGGPMDLSVPVVHRSESRNIRSVEISYTSDWQKQHARALESAYRRSPFYEFYLDDLQWVFTSREKYLFDLNEKIIQRLVDIIGLPSHWKFSGEYHPPVTEEKTDLRYAIHPKSRCAVPVPGYEAPVYTQVFEESHGFYPDLSILDLLFHCGPDTATVLRSSIHPGSGEFF